MLGAHCARAQVQVPQLMNYQSQLITGAGTGLPTADYSLTFRIYDAAQGGTLVWGPQVFNGTAGAGHGPKVPVVKGYFNVMLGPTDTEARPLGSAFAASATRYVEIQIGNGAPLAPRQQLVSSPFAFSAANAANAVHAEKASALKAGDGQFYDWSSVFGNQNPSTGTIALNRINIPPGGISADKVAFTQKSISADHIVNDSVGAAQLAPNSVDVSELKDNAVSSAKIGNGEVKRVDIGDGEVATQNIAEGAVTWSKRAHRAVRRATEGAVAAAGLGEIAVSGLCRTFVATSTNPTPVPELRAQVTCGGSPVLVTIGPAPRVNAPMSIHAQGPDGSTEGFAPEIHILRKTNGGPAEAIAILGLPASGRQTGYSPITFVDTEVKSGETYEYSVAVKVSADGTSLGINHAVLTLAEM
ncbi:MAG: hypothetical protein EOP84_11255 [Verrucomicrobiaceae bacterium]|nr:MAG: hypothetical protein EOP84_11255 [Verrucomicrobiaceae bacterium]